MSFQKRPDLLVNFNDGRSTLYKNARIYPTRGDVTVIAEKDSTHLIHNDGIKRIAVLG